MLASFDIGTMMSQENQIKNIPIDMLETYHNHKFQLYTGERLEDMVESIKANGILLPIIVQPLGNGNYEILSGHNRTNAAKIAGLDSVPAVIKENLSDDEAEMYVIETNLSQRGFNDLRISEQAAVLAMRHSKMFSEEKRQQIAEELGVMEGKSKSKLEKTGEEYGLKKDTVARLLRVDKLIPEMKAWVDDKQLPVRAAVELSYISENGQKLVYDVFSNLEEKVNIKKSKAIRKAFETYDEISEDDLLEVITDEPWEKENIRFADKNHKKGYNALIKSMRKNDCYHKALAYLITLDNLCREHTDDLFDLQEDTIKPEGVHKLWQTATSQKTSRLAFNLWNDFTGTVDDEADELNDPERNYAVDEIFCCNYAPFYYEAIKLRYPEYNG